MKRGGSEYYLPPLTLTHLVLSVSVSVSQYYILTPARSEYMARVTRGKSKKYDWMQTKLAFQYTASATGSPHADSKYFDVAQCLSLTNRKLIRQGNLFRIKNLRVHTDDDKTLRFKVATIPTNWVSRNAWVKGEALWDEMNATALSEGSMTMLPKYHDYKVYMNAAHKASGVADNAIPCDADGNAVSLIGAEWVYSKYADSGATSDNYDVMFLGQHAGTTDDYTTVGLIEAYRQSRIKPQASDPEWPSDALTSPWFKLFGDDDQTSDVLTSLRDDNDSPPYPPARYIGDGASADDGGFTVGTGVVGKLTSAPQGFTVPAFNAPCGLFRVEIDDSIDMDNVTVHVSFDAEVLGPMDM